MSKLKDNAEKFIKLSERLHARQTLGERKAAEQAAKEAQELARVQKQAEAERRAVEARQRRLDEVRAREEIKTEATRERATLHQGAAEARANTAAQQTQAAYADLSAQQARQATVHARRDAAVDVQVARQDTLRAEAQAHMDKVAADTHAMERSTDAQIRIIEANARATPPGSAVQLDNRGRVVGATGDAATEIAKAKAISKPGAVSAITNWAGRWSGRVVAGLAIAIAIPMGFSKLMPDSWKPDFMKSAGGMVSAKLEAGKEGSQGDAAVRGATNDVIRGALHAPPPGQAASTPAVTEPGPISQRNDAVSKITQFFRESAQPLGLNDQQSQCVVDIAVIAANAAFNKADFTINPRQHGSWAETFRTATMENAQRCALPETTQEKLRLLTNNIITNWAPN